jgi:hypothetical protein
MFWPRLDFALFVELICSRCGWGGIGEGPMFLLPRMLWTPSLLKVCVFPLNRYKKLLDIEIITKLNNFYPHYKLIYFLLAYFNKKMYGIIFSHDKVQNSFRNYK